MIVFGGIYRGLFSPTEGAAIGALLTFVVGLARHAQNRKGLNVVNNLARHVLQHKQIKPNWWCDFGNFHQQNDENAEPNQVKTGFLNHWQHHSCRQHNHADAG